MIDERMFNLLRDQLSAAQAEKSSLYAQVTSLTEEVHMLRESMNSRDAGLEKTIAKLQTTISGNNRRISALTSALEEKDKINASLLKKIEDLNQRLLHNKGKRFSRTSEQAALLNNRNVDGRSYEKDDFDGKKPNGDAVCPDETTTECKKQRRRVNPSSHESEKQFVNETITHRLEEYYDLPEGGHYIKRDGKVDITLYAYIEMQPAKVIKHVYEVARVALRDGKTIISSLPEEVRKAAVDGCPFTAEMLAFIYCEKYAYHSSINTVKKKLRDMGAVFSKSALNRYYHKGIDALMDCLSETLHGETRKCDYLMVDETCELVAVVDDKTGDFDDAEKHPGITHVGCWVHARRNFVDALESDRKNCMDVIETIAELFDVEYTSKLANMNALERKEERHRRSVPILTRLYGMLKTMSKDLVLMSNTMMAKAINYILNQWQSLRNFILNGKVEISNNLVEQRMKTIKLAMKNSQNIGSEEAAERHAFMHSMFESCHLNRIRPMDYFSDLFQCYRTLDDVGKVAMLPCYYTNKN